MNFQEIEVRDEQGRHGVLDPDLEALAHQILVEFESQRSAMAPPGKQFAKVGQKYALYFYRAAELCQELGLSAPEFVTVQVERMSTTGHFWPNAIANKEAFEQEQVNKHQRRLSAVRSYAAQLDLFKAREKLYGPKLALKDAANDFSPLFRCVMSRRHGVREVEEAYALQAVLELEAQPVAGEVFAGEVEFLDEYRARYEHAVRI